MIDSILIGVVINLIRLSWIIITIDLKQRSSSDIIELCTNNQIPFASVKKPSELLEDEHLVSGNHLYDTELTDGY